MTLKPRDRDETCVAHALLVYKLDEVLNILRAWGTLFRRVFAALLIAGIIAIVGLVVRTTIHLESASAAPSTVQAQGGIAP